MEEEYAESENVFQGALQEYPDSMEDYFSYLDDLLEFLTRLNPKRGINDFHYINQDFPLNLEKIRLVPPLKALKAVLRMFTISDRWLEAL